MYSNMKQCGHVLLASATVPRRSTNPKLDLSLKCLLSPPCRMLEEKLAKNFRQRYLSANHHKENISCKIVCLRLLFNGLYSWQTTNPDQIHKTTTSQKQRRKSMHSHFRISWDYDTGMIKGRIDTCSMEGRSCDQYFIENQRGSLLLVSNQHWVVSF